jgi:hypothetical protein
MTVVKGDVFMVIGTYASAGSDDDRFELIKQIGRSRRVGCRWHQLAGERRVAPPQSQRREEVMTHLQRATPILAALVLFLAACGGGGGGGATSSGSAGGAATSEPTEAPTNDAPPTDAPVTTPAATTAGGGGGAAAGVCDLVTADELAKIFNVSAVTTTVFAGPPDTCSVDSDAGDALVAWSYSVTNAGTAQATYDAFVSDPSSVEVSGIGDSAALVENTGLLVLKGAALSVIGVTGGGDDLSDDERNELAKQIGAIAAGRM